MVNTPGWISGGSGRCLQVYTEELVNPDFIIALQRGRELEHLLVGFSSSKIKRLPVSTRVRPRNAGERAELRAMQLGKYFENAGTLVLDMRKIRFERTYIGTGDLLEPKQFGEDVAHAERVPEGLILVAKRSLTKREVEALEGKFGHVKILKKGAERSTIVGLADDTNELLALGIVESFDWEGGRVVVTTPLTDANSVKVIQVGSMKITKSGKEIGTIKPGTF
jgi:polynucleotide 5'-kinase involved in rRNA processing